MTKEKDIRIKNRKIYRRDRRRNNLKILFSIIIMILSIFTNFFMFITFNLTNKEEIKVNKEEINKEIYKFEFLGYKDYLHRSIFWAIIGITNIIFILSIIFLVKYSTKKR